MKKASIHRLIVSLIVAGFGGNLTVESAHAIGAGPWRTIFKHIIPNVLSVVIIKA